MEAYEAGGHLYHATLPTDSLLRLSTSLLQTREFGFERARKAQEELGQRVRSALEKAGFPSVAAEGYQAPGVVVSYTRDADIASGKKFRELGLQPMLGRTLTEADEQGCRRVCVVRARLLEEIDYVGDPLQLDLRVGTEYVRVVGVLPDLSFQSPNKVVLGIDDRAQEVYVPFATMVDRFGLSDTSDRAGSQEHSRVELHQMVCTVADGQDVLAVAKDVQAVLTKLHDKRDYEVVVPLELLESKQSTQRVFDIVLPIIAGISLLVGGIGILNIMLASVTERTREIGIRRAIGASRADITTQFLMETVTLAATGGVFGILLGISFVSALRAFTDWQPAITPGSVALSMAVSCLTGIVFGIRPAQRGQYRTFWSGNLPAVQYAGGGLPVSIGDAGGDRDLHEQLGRVQRGDRDGGARRLVGREVLRVLLVVAGQVLAPGQVCHRDEHVVERGPRGGEDDLDPLERVAGLLADVPAELAGDRVPAGLAGHEDEVSEAGRGREVRIRVRQRGPDDLLLHGVAHRFGPMTPPARRVSIRAASRPRRSRSTVSVCSPRSGAGVRTEPGVSESRTGAPTMRTLPARGWAISTRAPRAFTCGCSTTCGIE